MRPHSLGVLASAAVDRRATGGHRRGPGGRHSPALQRDERKGACLIIGRRMHPMRGLFRGISDGRASSAAVVSTSTRGRTNPRGGVQPCACRCN